MGKREDVSVLACEMRGRSHEQLATLAAQAIVTAQRVLARDTGLSDESCEELRLLLITSALHDPPKGPFYVWTGTAGECNNKTDTLRQARALVARFKAHGAAAYITNSDNEVVQS